MTVTTSLKVCLCIVALAAMPVVATGYELHYDADGPALNDVCAFGVDGHAVFWTVGDSGRVFKAVDGQLTDSFTLGGGDYDLHGVSFFSDWQTGYIVGYKREAPDLWKGIVFRTLNGGTNWQSQCPDFLGLGIELPFLKVQCVQPHHVWVSCGNGYVVWSNDWTSWSIVGKPGGNNDYSYLWGLWCFDSLHAWVASDESRMVAKTENMMSWTPYYPLPNDSLSYRGVGLLDPTSGPDFDSISVAGSRGEIVSTTNGGSNWSKESYNPYQWWRGISQNHTDCGSRLCVGTSGTRYDLNDAEQVEVGYDHWNVSVGTNAAIVVDSFNTSPGILEECTLNWLNAVSTSGDSVLIYFRFTNTTDRDSVVDVYLWRSIMQEDFGGNESAYFYSLEDSFPDWFLVHQDETDTFVVTNYVPTNQTFWFALTTSKGPNCSASPNVDSARGDSAPPIDPLYPSDWIYSSDAPDDHGSSLYYQWDTIPHDPETRMSYAIIRPPTDTTHPYYTGHRGGLVKALEDGIYQNRSSYTEGSLVTGERYHRGVRPYTDRLYGVTSQHFPQDTATPVDNVEPPMVTGCSAKFVPQINACELWWNPVPDEGSSARPDTFEPNLGGYWVCPYIDGVTDDYHDDHINHPAPLFRNHYIAHMDTALRGHHWYYSVTARDRSGNKGEWCPDDSIYIPIHASTTPMATAYNNGTHLARVPGTADEYLVYESNDEVHYASSTDGGIEWHNWTLLDTGASPAIATDDAAHVWTVYLKDNTIRYKSSTPTVAWSGGVLYDPNDPTVVLGPPSITARTTSGLHYAYAAFPLYDLDAGTSIVKVIKFDDTTSVALTVEATPNQAMSDSFVSIALTPGDSVHCCWQRGSSILYSEARVTPTQWTSISWTSPSALTMPGSDAKHPFCAAWGNQVIIVWSDQTLGEIMRTSRVVATQGTWSLSANVSLTQEFSDFPQASSPCAVSWEDLKEDENWEVRARAGTELIALTEDANGNSRYAHISAELADSSDTDPAVLYASWTDGTAEDDYYEVKSRIYDGSQDDGGMAASQVAIAVTELSSVAPNPFRRSAGIRYQLARPGRTKLSVFDAAGREVRTLVNSEQSRGAYTVTWNGTDVRGRSVPRGVYFLRFAAPDCTAQRKLTLTR